MYGHLFYPYPYPINQELEDNLLTSPSVDVLGLQEKTKPKDEDQDQMEEMEKT